MQSFIDVYLAISVDASELAGLLVDTDLMGAWEHDGVVHLYWDDTTWNPQLLDSIKAALQRLGVGFSPDQIGMQPVPWQDWNSKWTEMVQPVQIGRRIWVRPSWTAIDLPENGIELILDPKQAFGTGHHTTTQLLGEFLEECIQGEERVLDIGTGSGILAMIALRLGAKFSLGLDKDPVAISCARDYAIVNQFGSELKLCTEDLRHITDDPFDLILANIDRRTLLSAHQPLANVSRLNTILCLSGVLQSDHDDLVTYYRQHGWQCREVRKREEWIGVRLKKVE